MSHEGTSVDAGSSLKKDLSQTIFGPKADDDDKAATTKFIDYTLEKVKSGELIIHKRSGPHEPSRNECEGFERLSDDVFINYRLKLSQQSTVYLGAKKDGKEITLIAVKTIAFHRFLEEPIPMAFEEMGHYMLEEAEAIKQLRSENIIGYMGCGLTRDIDFPWKSIYLAMEICDQETLHDNVNKMKKENLRFTNRDCMSIAKQLANALKVVHEAKLKHGDIKPSNVLFKIGRKVVKLSDFSLQNPLRHHHYYSHKRIGEWRAPEVLCSCHYEESSDVFALALTIYYAWSNGKHAFGDDPNSQYWNIAKNRGSNLANTPFKPKGEQLILLENMLLHDYKKRPTAEQVYKEPCIQNAKDRLEYPEGEKISLETNFKYTSEQDQEGECIAVLDRRSKSMNAFTPSSRMWTPMQAIKEDVTCELTVALLNNRIFTLLQDRTVYSIEYNVPNAEWIQQANMDLDHGAFPSAAALGEHLYVVGGSQRETEVVKEGEVFHNEEWGRIRDMNTSRKGHSLVACKDCIYSIGGWEEEEVVGGFLEEDATAKGEKYDPKTDVWSPIQSMNRVRYAPAAASLGEKIYVLGGQIELGSMLTEAECYDANTDCWTFLANMNIRRSFFSAVAVGGKMYAVAGDDVAPQTIEEYDPETNTWRQIQELKSMEIWPKGSLAVTRRKIAL